MEKARECEFYPRCWDCEYYSPGVPANKELESCKNKIWYTTEGRITAIGLINMLGQMEQSELCPHFKELE